MVGQTPVVIDVVDSTDFALWNNPCYQNPPFTYDGALYLFLVFGVNAAPANNNYLYCFQSQNGGQTWNLLNAAGAPEIKQGSQASAFFDGNHTVTAAVIAPATSGASAHLFLQQFNLATGTWGAAFATGGPLTGGPPGPIFVRPDGTVLVTYDTGAAPSGRSNFLYTIWNGSSWSTPADAGAAFYSVEPATRIFVSAAGGVMDAAGNVNLMFSDAGYLFPFWQQILAGTAGLGNSHQFTAVTLSTTDGDQPYGAPVIAGTQLIWPVAVNSTYFAVYVGNSLTNPSWTLSAPISSEAPVSNPSMFFDPGNQIGAIVMPIVSNTSQGTAGILLVSINYALGSTPLTGWSTPTPQWDMDVNPVPNQDSSPFDTHFYVGFDPIIKTGYMFGDASLTTATFGAATYYGSFSYAGILKIALIGVKRWPSEQPAPECPSPTESGPVTSPWSST